MFSDKKFNLPNKLIEASKLVMEERELDTLYSKFNDFLEENYHVDKLTEEEIAFIFEEGFFDWLTGSKKSVGRQSALGDNERGPASITSFSGGSESKNNTPVSKTDTAVRGAGVPPMTTFSPKPTPPPLPNKGEPSLDLETGIKPQASKPPASAARPSAPSTAQAKPEGWSAVRQSIPATAREPVAGPKARPEVTQAYANYAQKRDETKRAASGQRPSWADKAFAGN